MSNSPITPNPIAPEPAAADRPYRRVPLYLTIAAWAVPIMVVGQFAMLAIVPLAVVVVGVIADKRARGLRPWVGLLAVTYLTPLAIWILRPDGAQSLSRDIHPAFVVLIAAVSLVVLAKIHWSRRRSAARTTNTPAGTGL